MSFLSRLGGGIHTKNPEASKDYREIGLKTNNSNYGWYTCVHCGRKFRKGSIDIDHIIPQSKGGTNRPENLQCLCIHCNRSKGNRTMQTSEDLRKRRDSYKQYKRSVVLKPILEQKRKNVNQLVRKVSDEDLNSLLREARNKNDKDLIKHISKEIKRREK